jgi:hypothetical protein
MHGLCIIELSIIGLREFHLILHLTSSEWTVVRAPSFPQKAAGL